MVEGKQFKLTRFNVQVPFSLFYGRVTSPESAESASFFANFCPKTEDSFPNFSNGKWHFGAKGPWANHLTFSFSHYSIRSRYTSDLDSFLCSTDCRS